MHGVLCLGGAEGALLGAAAMQALPVGVPKLLVSPCASGRRRFGDFVGESDVCVMHSVVDILGLNGISRPIFDNAAAAMAGMVHDAGSALGTLGEHCVGITMLGQTTPGVMRLREALVARRPRAGDLPRQRRRRARDGAPVRGGRAAGRRRLHALRAGELADGRHPRHRPGAPDASPAGSASPRSSSPAAWTSSTRARATRVPERYRDRKTLLPQPGRDARAAHARRGGRARRARRRAPQRGDRPGARRRAHARVLARRRRGRRPLGPGRRRRVPGRAVRRAAPRHPVRGRRRPRRRPRRSPTSSPSATCPSSRRPSMPDGRPFSQLPPRPRAAGHRLVPGALGHHPGADRLLRAARRAPADRHRHDHRAGGLAARGGEGRRAVHGAVLGRLLAAAHARDRVRASARSRCARRRSTRSSTTSCAR